MVFVLAKDLSFRYPSQPDLTLRGLAFSIDKSSRIGLVGGNGSGKTTLLKLIRQELQPVSGSLIVERDVSVGYLPQEVSFGENLTVRDYLWSARPKLAQLKQKADVANRDDESCADAVADFYARGGDTYESRILRLLSDFRISEDKLNLLLELLSGGEKTKVAIIRLLLADPTLLLLDEPTNHLEMQSRAWLERYLHQIDIPYVAVSHDRRFLDGAVDHIWELKNGELTQFSGNYSFYKRARENERERKHRLHDHQHRKVKRLEAAAAERRQDAHKMERFKAKRSVSKKGSVQKRDAGSASTKADPSKKMRSAVVMSRRIEAEIKVEAELKPFIEKERKIQLRQSELKNPVVVDVREISKAFGSNEILESFSFTVRNGDKVGVIGSNGSGKSTLLKILIGELEPDRGSVVWAPQAQVGYYAQEHENLDRNLSILDEVLQGRVTEQALARTILGGLNLRRDKVFQKIDSLSLGERSKTALAKALFTDANVLLLDEPTNHLELESLEAFEKALREYNGTVVLVTHDRYLLDEAATAILDMDSGRFFAGRYTDYEERYL